MIYTPLTKKALLLIYNAHMEQTDKNGIPYVFHPYHLAEQMEDENTTLCALLHDVVEDTPIKIEDLRREFPSVVCDAVDLLTRRYDESYMDYIKRIKENPIARKVKIADLTHNSDATRLDGEPDIITIKRMEKYREALRLLCGDCEKCEGLDDCEDNGCVNLLASKGNKNKQNTKAKKPEKEDKEKKNFTLASFNICSSHFLHGKYTKENLDMLIEKIKSSNADVMALQEVDLGAQRSEGVDMAKELAKGAGYDFSYFIKIRDFQGGEYGTAIISKYPITESETFNYRVKLAKQGTSCGYVKLNIQGENVTIFNTHLSVESEDANTETMRCLHDILRDYYASDSDGFICCGDFNTNPGKLEANIPWLEVGNKDILTFNHDRSIDNMIYCGKFKLDNMHVIDTTSDNTTDHDMLISNVRF